MIYCDSNASTAVRPEVLEAMLPFLTGQCGNPSSIHTLGTRARCAVEEARDQVAALIGASPAEIVFTSGGTESNNLAIQGTAGVSNARIAVTTAIEHASVRQPVARLKAQGFRAVEIGVDTAGRVDPRAIGAALAEPVAVVSVGWANNEIGTIQPIEDIGRCCRARAVPLHVDAVQAAGKVPLHTRGVDLLSLSAHKFGGPKGVGALFVRRDTAIAPVLLGGGQERGRRAGTENVAGIVAMGEACRLAYRDLAALAESCVAWRDALWVRLSTAIDRVRRNSPAGAGCLPNTLNVCFDGVRGEALVAALDLAGVAVSGGSACAAGAGEPSHVLRALGCDEDTARDGVRFSFGRSNTASDVEAIAASTVSAVARIRAAGRV